MHQQLVAVARHLVKFLCCLWVTNLLAQEVVPPIPNDYAQVTSFNYCTNEVIIQTSSIGAFTTPGNEIILIQMNGAPREISDDQNHGRHLNDLATAGYYEIHSINQALTTSNPGELRLRFVHNIEAVFDVSQSVQVVTFPKYTSANVSNAVTGQFWNGTTGGVVAFQAQDSISIAATINASEAGCQGGEVQPDFDCFGISGFPGFDGTSLDNGGEKGEGSGDAWAQNGRGRNGSGGGGGNDHNCGGGGGGNAGQGGQGGLTSGFFCSAGFGGFGGDSIPSNQGDRLFMGGGGGAADVGNGNGTWDGNNAGNGGGIVILSAPTIHGLNGQITARGASVTQTTNDDAGSGGGAGGSIFLDAETLSGTLTIDARGGDGGDVFDVIRCPGPGGGGGGGAILTNMTILPASFVVDLSPGVNGVNLVASCDDVTGGANAGDQGKVFGERILSRMDIPFQPITLNSSFLPDTLCPGDSIVLDASATSSHPLIWSWSDNASTQSTAIYQPSNSAFFTTTISYEDLMGSCDSSFDVLITVNQALISFDQFPEDPLQIGDTARVTANVASSEPIAQWNWDIGEGFISSDSNLLLVSPLYSRSFCLDAVDEEGCLFQACEFVFIDRILVVLPGAFSPNGDGLNDVYEVFPHSNLQVVFQKIHNRWGEEVASIDGLNFWDGRWQGVDQPAGTYLIYIVSENIYTGFRQAQYGRLSLIR
ncbi:MAG TPA: hypothetical protein DCF84_05020 [Bacteroidetes bacterium]|nr:hypothetical protein [Bacteroidota bacterium]